MDWLLVVLTLAAAFCLGYLVHPLHDDLHTWLLGFKCGWATVEWIIDRSGYTIKAGEHGEFIVAKGADDARSREP